jgi:hypothetical protein
MCGTGALLRAERAISASRNRYSEMQKRMRCEIGPTGGGWYIRESSIRI